MMAMRKIFYTDFSRALEEAYHQKDQGCKVSVGREVGTNEWYVRAIDLPSPRAQGA